MTARTAIGVVGNCQAALMREALAAAVGAAGPRFFYHSFDSAPSPAHARDLESCRLLLVQDIGESEDYLQRMAGAAGIERVAFPCLRFSSCWPFDDFNGGRDQHARAMDPVDGDLFYDAALARLRRLGLAPAERLDRYRRLDVPNLLDPIRLHDFERRRLEDMDARYDIGIGAFLLETFRREPLFYAVNRPAGALLTRLLAFLMTRLGLSTIRETVDLDRLRGKQVPVHPEVARRLEIVWADESTLYNDGRGGRHDWAGYVRDYVSRYG